MFGQLKVLVEKTRTFNYSGGKEFTMIDKTSDKKIYKHKTKSIYELATCLALGAKVVSVDRETNIRFYEFSLESETVDLEKACLELASKILTINAYELLDAFTRAKSIIHSK